MRKGGTAVSVLALGAVLLAAPADAQRSGAGTSPSMRMRDTTIEGERPTPDVFFIVPTGKGGNLASPFRRDYSAEILQPVVKPWLEKDQNVSLAAVQNVSRVNNDWKDAFDAPAPPPPLPAEPVLPSMAPSRAPRIEIPTAARSIPEAPSPLPAAPVPPPAPLAPIPPPVAAAPVPARPVPPPAAPVAAPPAAASDDVPILVPPQ